MSSTASSIAGKIRCYIIIVQKIRRSNYISMEELTAHLEEKLRNYDYEDDVGTSVRTMRRNFKEISRLFGFDIEYSKLNNGYFISNEQSQDANFERLLEQFDLMDALSVNNTMRKFVFTEKRKSKGTEYISPLIEAIKQSKRVKFRYRKFDNTVTKETRTVEPYALREFKGRWYLLAVEVDGRPEERGWIKTWGLDRIENFYPTNDTFNKNNHLNIEDEFKDTFGITSNKELEVEEVILSFTPLGGRYNESFPLHESQVTLIDNAEEFRIKLNVKLTYDFIMELLSQSQNMQVITPLHLRDALNEIHRKAIEMNNAKF